MALLRKICCFLLLVFFQQYLYGQVFSKKQIDSMMYESMKFYKGEGRPVDLQQSFKLQQRCADAGSRVAMYNLAQNYLKGSGCEINHDSAILWYSRAGELGYTKAWFRLGYAYKTGRLGDPDYDKAWLYICKAADMNYAQAIYYKGYMLYTGLGCTQNYTAAYELFRIAAKANDPWAYHFIGLCMYNGYGTEKNRDSASYFFRRSRELGWKASDDSYGANGPKNEEIAAILANKVKAAQSLNKPGYPLNVYSKVRNDLPANEIEGVYEGWLLTYDWSGQHVVKADQLHIELKYENDSLKGIWRENDTLRLPINAMLTRSALLFYDMQYNKGDNYRRPTRSVLKFDKAKLQLVTQDKRTYLSGNLQLYSVNRKEPAKPMYVALVRTSNSKSDKLISYRGEDGQVPDISNVNVFPNPFTDLVNVEFKLDEKAVVNTELLDINGKVVYKNDAGALEPGTYTLPIRPVTLANGSYILKIQYGRKNKTVKLIKQG